VAQAGPVVLHPAPPGHPLCRGRGGVAPAPGCGEQDAPLLRGEPAHRGVLPAPHRGPHPRLRFSLHHHGLWPRVVRLALPADDPGRPLRLDRLKDRIAAPRRLAKGDPAALLPVPLGCGRFQPGLVLHPPGAVLPEACLRRDRRRGGHHPRQHLCAAVPGPGPCPTHLLQDGLPLRQDPVADHGAGHPHTGVRPGVESVLHPLRLLRQGLPHGNRHPRGVADRVHQLRPLPGCLPPPPPKASVR